jgi:hypothetical protein
MQTRKAANVLPEPVGAAIRAFSRRLIAGQPETWGGDGPCGNRPSNQDRTAGCKEDNTPMQEDQPSEAGLVAKERRKDFALSETTASSGRGVRIPLFGECRQISQQRLVTSL